MRACKQSLAILALLSIAAAATVLALTGHPESVAQGRPADGQPMQTVGAQKASAADPTHDRTTQPDPATAATDTDGSWRRWPSLTDF